MKPKLKTFLDPVGRTIIGELASETDTTISIRNPAVVHCEPNRNTGQITLQLLPAFFKEFLADQSQGTTWTYNKQNIAVADDFGLDVRFEAQYNQIFSIVQELQPTADKPKVVKLFDEEA
jgi:hypothetical protein